MYVQVLLGLWNQTGLFLGGLGGRGQRGFSSLHFSFSERKTTQHQDACGYACKQRTVKEWNNGLRQPIIWQLVTRVIVNSVS